LRNRDHIQPALVAARALCLVPSVLVNDAVVLCCCPLDGEGVCSGEAEIRATLVLTC
jgi:hypothetical protein